MKKLKPICDEHEMECKYYCKECNQPLCASCEGHSNHCTSSFLNIFSSKDFAEIISELEAILANTERAEELASQILKNIKGKRANVEGEVIAINESILTEIRKILAERLDFLHNQFTSKFETLGKIAQKLTATKKKAISLKGCIEAMKQRADRSFDKDENLAYDIVARIKNLNIKNTTQGMHKLLENAQKLLKQEESKEIKVIPIKEEIMSLLHGKAEIKSGEEELKKIQIKLEKAWEISNEFIQEVNASLEKREEIIRVIEVKRKEVNEYIGREISKRMEAAEAEKKFKALEEKQDEISLKAKELEMPLKLIIEILEKGRAKLNLFLNDIERTIEKSKFSNIINSIDKAMEECKFIIETKNKCYLTCGHKVLIEYAAENRNKGIQCHLCNKVSAVGIVFITN